MEKRRAANWDQTEKDLLLNLVLEQLEIIENPKIDTNTNVRKREAWNTVHVLFNEVSTHNRSLEQIQNQWRKTKSLAKIKNSAISDTSIEDSPANYVRTQNEPTTTDDEILNTEDDTSTKERNKPTNIKRKRNRKCQCDSESESSKRLKLLDLSIKQKELEMKYLEENHNIEKRRSEMLEMQEKSEHNFRVKKLKLEIEKLTTNGFCASSSPSFNGT